jgi:hypothetical protein
MLSANWIGWRQFFPALAHGRVSEQLRQEDYIAWRIVAWIHILKVNPVRTVPRRHAPNGLGVAWRVASC